MKKAFELLNFCFLAFFCTACGYHYGNNELETQYSSISIPYIEGDLDGEFTIELTKQIAKESRLKYCDEDGDIELHVCIVDNREEYIGFRYDRESSGELKNNLIPSEGRHALIAEVTLIDAFCGTVIRGPDMISARIEYDHDYYTNLSGVNVFSLGQLNDIDLAQKMARRSLARNLSKNIVNHLLHGW
jgi:hypothetical protein